MEHVRKENAKNYYPRKRGGGGGGGGGCHKRIKDFAVNDITVTEQKLLELAKETRDRR